MTKIVTTGQMRAIEAAANQAGVTVCPDDGSGRPRGGQGCFGAHRDALAQTVVVLCGAGNNGGDGLVAAHYLAEAGAAVSVYCPSPPDEQSPNLQRVRARGLPVESLAGDADGRILERRMKQATVVVDAVFGTGVRLPLAGRSADLLRQAAQGLAGRSVPPLIVAVDCPSGLNCDTGEIDPAALRADVTVTFAAAKLGQFTFPAAEFLGQLIVADIGVGADLPELSEVKLALGTRETVKAALPLRPRNAHKGTFGRALVVAGSISFTGAAYLAGAAAYRVGAGLVTLAVPEPLHAILAGQLPEATWVLLPDEVGVIAASAVDVVENELPRTQAWLVGPGLGTEKQTGLFLRRLLHLDGGAGSGGRKGSLGFAVPGVEAKDAPVLTEPLPPLVVDADGLRLLAQVEDWPKRLRHRAVLTPHPGEMAALTGLDRDAIQADRLGVARRFAREWEQVVVLKGAFTVVAAPDGETTLQPFATSALARAGTGDVLAGTIAGLLAQGVAPYAAAVAGTYLHGRAGELAAKALGQTASVLAGDVLAALPEALAEMLAN